MSISWLAPPRLTHDEARARTIIAQRAKGRRLSLGDIEWDFSLEPLAARAICEFGASDWSIRGEWGGALFEVRLPSTAVDQWLRARFPSVDFPSLPEPLRSAVFESVVRDALNAVEAAGRHGPVRIERMDEAPAQTSAGLGHDFGAVLCNEDSTLWAALSTDSLGLTLLAGLMTAWPAARGPTETQAINILLQAEIGSAALPADELASLRPGDAILLRQCWIDQGGNIRLRHSGGALRARVQDTHLVVTEPFRWTEKTMDPQEDDAGESIGEDGRTALNALPVKLRFDVGQRTMSLREVGELQVGQIIELDRALSHVVNIRANGALIGEGALIEIDGRMAVSITSLGPQEEY